MRRVGWWAVGLVVLAGCGGTPAAGPATGVTSTSASVTAGSTSSGVAPSKLQVTVPGLGGAPVPTSDVAVPSSEPPAESSAPPTTDAEDGMPTEASAPATGPAPDDTVDVQLVGCADCQVLGTHADVVAGFSAALIGQGGRAAIISVDASGALVGLRAVPYGVTFAAQPDGRLACGAGGRCLVLATQADGHAVLSAFGLGTDGQWTDLSGSDGFVSATDKAVPVLLEDALGAAVQVSDGTTTQWNVLAWNGSEFATIGCGPGGDTPDLATLDIAACLS